MLDMFTVFVWESWVCDLDSSNVVIPVVTTVWRMKKIYSFSGNIPCFESEKLNRVWQQFALNLRMLVREHQKGIFSGHEKMK